MGTLASEFEFGIAGVARADHLAGWYWWRIFIASVNFQLEPKTMGRKLNGTDLIHGDNIVAGLGAEVAPSISVTTSA